MAYLNGKIYVSGTSATDGTYCTSASCLVAVRSPTLADLDCSSIASFSNTSDNPTMDDDIDYQLVATSLNRINEFVPVSTPPTLIPINTLDTQN